MERGGREDGVDRLGQMEIEHVGRQDPDAVAVRSQVGARLRDHGRVDVDGDDAAVWQAFGQVRRDPPRAAADVEHGLVAREREPLERREPHGLHRPGHVVVALAVPTGPHGAESRASRSRLGASRAN